VPTRSLTSGPRISKSSNNLSSKISEIVFSKLISDFEVKSESWIFNLSQTLS